MARRLNWQKRAFDFKPKRAFKDEEEFRKADWAARFIERAEERRWACRYDHRKVTSEAQRQADADRQRAQASANRAVREKPPWED
jgi:hypothetical protein